MAPLSRPALCRLLGFNSFTAAQTWLVEVVDEAWDELKDDFLLPFAEIGEQHPPGTQVTKDIRTSNSSCLYPLSAIFGSCREHRAPELLPTQPDSENSG